MLKQLVIAALLALPAAQAQRPLILIVHGRGQAGRDSAQFRRDALHALETSLHHIDAQIQLEPTDVKLAWYADVLDARADGGTTSICPSTQVSAAIRQREAVPSVLSFIAMLAAPIFDAASRDSKATDIDDIRSLSGDLRFLADFDTRCAAEARVTEALRQAHREKRPVILVSHSLGALVTWSAFAHIAEMRDTTIGSVDRWITLGSPLASKELRELIFGERNLALTVPASIRKWVNIVGTDDPFAAHIGDASSDSIEELTTSGTHTDPHHILSYLYDDVTARAVMDAWNSSVRRER